MPSVGNVLHGLADNLPTVTPPVVVLLILVVLGCCYVLYDAYSDP